ncbi:MAG: hypothetical protein J1E00_01995 [Oscillospiraceae bacterium]|nr:hypothetical protein [Oscillospiraceae bacterium]
MANVSLSKIIFTNISYDLDIEDSEQFSLEVKNEISLKLPKDTSDNSFLLVFETSVVEPEHNYLKIIIKANAFFDSDEKLSSYDNVVKSECFPVVFKTIAQKIDQILEILDYPRLNIKANTSDKN